MDALAHPTLRASDPSDKATLQQPPPLVSADFAEPPTRDSHLEIYDACGNRLDRGATSVAGRRVSVSLAARVSGRYTARFFVTSAVDGHPIRGSFSFTVSEGRPCRVSDGAGDHDRHMRNRSQDFGAGVWDIPKDDFAIGLAIAALIGAAAGRVYVGLTGR